MGRRISDRRPCCTFGCLAVNEIAVADRSTTWYNYLIARSVGQNLSPQSFFPGDGAIMNFVQVEQSTFTQKKRKLAGGACVRCHERKVKCDAGSSAEALLLPCRNCVVSGDADDCRSVKRTKTECLSL
ncbi:hypothetical protein CC79DRAFT_1332592 [Sarocladium strictum]